VVDEQLGAEPQDNCGGTNQDQSQEHELGSYVDRREGRPERYSSPPSVAIVAVLRVDNQGTMTHEIEVLAGDAVDLPVSNNVADTSGIELIDEVEDNFPRAQAHPRSRHRTRETT
jgi:hypothetical protein